MTMSVRSWAPGRVNLIGEHTDYNGGFVLPMAIHLGVKTTVTKRDDRMLVVKSVQVPREIVLVDLDELAPGCVEGWATYVVGAVWALPIELTHGFDIEIDGDVPLGAGLSSSAAVECSVLVALSQALDLVVEPRELARLAKKCENEFVGVPTGAMDQVASMLGREDHVLLFDTQTNEITPIPFEIRQAGYELLVIDTRAAHVLVDGGYATRRATCEHAARILGVDSLRDVTDVETALSTLSQQTNDPHVVARARHVFSENSRVLATAKALTQRRFEEVGMLMVSSHESLRDDFEVSCPELDCAVEVALETGALGARLTGGGFGGSAIALVPMQQLANVAAAVTDQFVENGWLSPHCFTARPSRGAHQLVSA